MPPSRYFFTISLSSFADSNFLDFSCQASCGYGRGDDELESGRYLDSDQTSDDGTGFDSNRAQSGFYFCPNDFWRDFRT